MSKNHAIALAALLGFALTACADDLDLAIEDATYVAALSEGEGEPLDGAPAGDMEEGAQEDVEEQLESEGSVQAACSFKEMRQHVVQAYDQNGDGELDQAEGQQLREDLGLSGDRRQALAARHRFMRQQRLMRVKWIYDADGSGDLDEQEREQLRDDLEARCENRMAYLHENFDADDSGDLDEAEWEAVRAELRARIQARRQAHLEEYDANNNGELDPGEQLQFRVQRRAEIQARREELKQQFDADGSGTLDEEEKAALREHLRARVRGEHFGSEERF